MTLHVQRNDTKEIIRVRKYTIDDELEESIWSKEWYGRHVIGQDCEWAVNNTMVLYQLYPLAYFLILNGFKEVAPGAYGNKRCLVMFLSDCTKIVNKQGDAAYNKGHDIYWIIGYLTYYRYMKKNFKSYYNDQIEPSYNSVEKP